MSQNIAVIIPTYKETENIPLLLDKIFGVLPKTTVIFVDDSPQQYIDKLMAAIEPRKEKIIVISRVENAKTVPSLSFLKRLAQVLNASLQIQFKL